MPARVRLHHVAVIALLTATAWAQQTKVLAPHSQIAPLAQSHHQEVLVPRSLVGGFWMIDANRKASIYLRNGLLTSSITVTPNLYLRNGVRYRLSSITLEPLGIATISINDGLSQHGVSPRAILTGYVELEYSWAWDPLCATVTSTDPVHSLIFTSSLQPSLIESDRPHQSASPYCLLSLCEGASGSNCIPRMTQRLSSSYGS